MTANAQENQGEVKNNSAEINFKRQAEMYERKLEQERQERVKLQEEMAQIKRSMQQKGPEREDEEYGDEPYVDHKVLDKKFEKFAKSFDEKIDKKAEEKARTMLEQRDREDYYRANADFNEVMSAENLERFVQKHPGVAQSLMRMPDSFERQRLVYESMKALGAHRKDEPKSAIQEKVDQNRRTPYYQPTGVSGPGYNGISAGKEYSPAEQKSAYEKMQQLKKSLRI